MKAKTGDDRVLITGAAGFGGSGLVKALLARGHAVTGLDIVAPLHADSLRTEMSHPAFRYVWKSIQDIRPEDIVGHSVVVHMAAQADVPLAFDSPRHTLMQNVEGTVAVLEAVRLAGCVSKLIYAGSGNEVGRPMYLPIDEDHPLTPHNPYAFSKAAAELAVWAWRRAYGIPAAVMSNGTVVGPNMRREIFIFKWIWNGLHNRPIVVEGGDQTRDITHVDDVIQAWTLAITAPEEAVVGRKFQVSYGEEHTVAELAGICMEVVRADVPIQYVGYRPGEEGQREAFSIERASRELGYTPKVPPREAIALTARWVRSLL